MLFSQGSGWLGLVGLRFMNFSGLQEQYLIKMNYFFIDLQKSEMLVIRINCVLEMTSHSGVMEEPDLMKSLIKHLKFPFVVSRKK